MSILSIDCGTQSLRAIIFSDKGDVLASEKVDFEPYYSRNTGWAEQSPKVYWESLTMATMRLKRKVPEIFNRIEEVTLTTQRSTIVALTKMANHYVMLSYGLTSVRRKEKLICFFTKHSYFGSSTNYQQPKWHTEEAKQIT